MSSRGVRDGQFVTVIGTACSTLAPLWPTIVVGIVKGPLQTPVVDARAECGPGGRSRTKLVIGASGTAPNVELSPVAVNVIV